MISYITATDAPIHLGRVPVDECAGVQLMCEECEPFPSRQTLALEDTTFDAFIGPAANPRGYTAITSMVVYLKWHIQEEVESTLHVASMQLYTLA